MKNIDHTFENKYDILAVYLAANVFYPFNDPSTRRSVASIQFIVLNSDPLIRQLNCCMISNLFERSINKSTRLSTLFEDKVDERTNIPAIYKWWSRLYDSSRNAILS